MDGLVKIYWKYGDEKRLDATCMMKNGLKNGYFTIYHGLMELRGKVETKTEYLNGVKHGDYEYYNRKNAKLSEKGRFEKDKMNGRFIIIRILMNKKLLQKVST